MTPHESIDSLYAQLLAQRQEVDHLTTEVKTLAGLVDTVLEDNDTLMQEKRADVRLIQALERAIVLLHEVIQAKDRNLESLVRR